MSYSAWSFTEVKAMSSARDYSAFESASSDYQSDKLAASLSLSDCFVLAFDMSKAISASKTET